MTRFALTCVLVFCEAGAIQPPDASAQTTPAGPVPPVKMTSFDPTVVRPSGALAQTRAALDGGDMARARSLAAAAAALTRDPVELSELRWLSVEAAEGAGDAAGARSGLEALANTPSPLQRWATLRLAKAVAEEDPARAAALTTPLLQERWAGQLRARRIAAQALAQTDAEAAVPLLRQLVIEADSDSGAASPGMPLAAILTQRGDEASLVEALSLYRRVASRAPLADVGHEAEAKAQAVLARLPAERRTELAHPPVDMLLARAQALYGALRNNEAEEAYAAVANATTDPSLRCEADFMRAKAVLRRRARSEGATLMEAVAGRCTADVQARALYAAAQAHDALGERADSIRLYTQLEQVAPQHRLADDAHLMRALALRGAGDEEGFLRSLAEMPERYPQGDMTPDALFRLGVQRLMAGDAQAALTAFEALRAYPEDTAEDALGRPEYWRGRALAALGRGPEAAEAYVGVATHYPLAYYAQLAMSRLAELDRPAFDHVAAELLRVTAEDALRFPRRPEMNTPAFARLLSLLRVGDLERAEIELEAQGFLGEGSDADALWLAAALLANGGDLARATTLSRSRLRSFRKVTPIGRGRAFWRLAYPRAFSPLIEETADHAGVPSSLVRAIAREESGFDQRAVSWAHAYGLVQVILPTARRFGEPLGLTISASTMREADTNLKVGTRFMRFLLDRYDDNPVMIPAAYNAGHNAADRWLRARPDMPLDEWVEAIPYAETRRYTRRVLQSYGVYRFLDTHEVPMLSLQLPHAHRSLGG